MLIKPPRELIKALKDPDAGTRRAAVDRLGFLQDMQAVKPLCDALQDPVKDVRSAAVNALKKIGVKTPAVIDALIACLNDPDPNVRYWASDSLDELGDPRAAEPILHAMGKYDQPELVKTLKHLPLGPSAVAPLGKALLQAIEQWHQMEQEIKNEDELAHAPDPREGPISAFRLIQDPAATPSFVKLVRDTPNELQVLKAVYLAFEVIGAPALPFLVEALKNPDPRGREEILRALGLLGDIKALRHLLTEVTPAQAALLLNDTLAINVVWNDRPAIRSLKKMGWEAAQLFLDLIKSPDAKVRAIAADIIGAAGDRKATPILHDALRIEPDETVRRSIIRGLETLSDPAALK